VNQFGNDIQITVVFDKISGRHVGCFSHTDEFFAKSNSFRGIKKVLSHPALKIYLFFERRLNFSSKKQQRTGTQSPSPIACIYMIFQKIKSMRQ
jgi:hypothetical protein